ncbi:Oxoglutarate/iron-dependent dioxygenase [Penicillium longicatenatum]|nr:Oxoglutarate/iron-dependent dioxygenase [Penicillium longicatenatum]
MLLQKRLDIHGDGHDNAKPFWKCLYTVSSLGREVQRDTGQIVLDECRKKETRLIRTSTSAGTPIKEACHFCFSSLSPLYRCRVGFNLSRSIYTYLRDRLRLTSPTYCRYLKPAFRWVIAPREDQAHLERIALCCVMRPSDKLLWKALDSPFLQKVSYREITTENETEVLNIICDTVRVQLVTSASTWRQSIA